MGEMPNQLDRLGTEQEAMGEVCAKVCLQAAR